MKHKFKLSKAAVHFLLILVSLCCIMPLVLVISISLTSDADISKFGYSLVPPNIDFSSYDYIFKKPAQLISSYMVTIAVTIIGTVVGLLITSMLGYGISRKDYKLARGTTFYIFFTMLFSAGLVPWYMMISNGLHLKDSMLALIVPYLVTPWFVMLMKGFFADIPFSIIEAGKIDGASEYRIFFSIILPISKAALATVGLFIMLTYWNDYYLSLMFISPSGKTISLQFMLYRMMSNVDFLKSALGSQSSMIAGVDIPDKSIRMAMCVLAAGPMLFVFPFFQKYFTKGITVGSVKG